MRICQFSSNYWILRYSFFLPARFILWRLTYRLGIYLPYSTQAGEGLYIGHFGGIVINPQSVIGKNCNISQGVTLGQVNRGKKQGCPVIGEYVYVGPGAKVIGHVHVGNHVAIGANCVVTTDIPDYAVVVGVPGQVISLDGSMGYVNYTDYPCNSGILRHTQA